MNDQSSSSETAARVAEAVRSFYDQHPYPPPVDDLERYRRRWDDSRRRSESHLFWPGESYRDDRSILVAGCGTSQAAKYALRWPRARVTGIDVSDTSLRHAEDLKRKHRLDNLALRRLPVERAAELGGTFDYIVCTGMLHHLPDPALGLAALRNVMAPNAAAHLMVYAPYGRAGVYLLQEYCRQIGVGPTAGEIDDLVSSLRALPQDHPLVGLLRKAPDFQHRAGLADALLHPQDRPFSVPQLLALLEQNGLVFGRWLRQAAYLPQCGALAGCAHRTLLERLPLQQQYAAVELFRGTMVRHTAIAYRDDGARSAQRIDFGHEGWPDYVPVRIPDTVTVKERLPAGAAAVLINPAHTYTDLYLPLDARELALYEAIDGRRPIRALAGGTDRLQLARELFERLWRYDLVVFDASSSSRSSTPQPR